MPRPPPLFGGGARADWEETEAAYVLRVEIPAGLKKDEIDLKVEEGKVVKISGEKKVEREERHENWQHMEHSSGKFMRTFSLPENCKTDHVTSSFENGVLKVTVPKKDVKNDYSHVKNIQVN
ncbi:hypothetical protein BUALT_Bualt11G0124300 [Buddleja alternifolia]|uniref:SHSP domain-containing protein n=1 Tax=Buddleja alternifolia TaxID=168488 RepID=A0AAV6X573_9LAMI|nr:hypothetical protein BUALT_Bualt11G0124300 [Buddleja alternifolia]